MRHVVIRTQYLYCMGTRYGYPVWRYSEWCDSTVLTVHAIRTVILKKVKKGLLLARAMRAKTKSRAHTESKLHAVHYISYIPFIFLLMVRDRA